MFNGSNNDDNSNDSDKNNILKNGCFFLFFKNLFKIFIMIMYLKKKIKKIKNYSFFLGENQGSFLDMNNYFLLEPMVRSEKRWFVKPALFFTRFFVVYKEVRIEKNHIL